MNCPQSGIATDGAHSVKNGLTRFRAVDIATGKELFCVHLGNQTINIGEFLGVVEAVKYIIRNNYEPQTIYTDSMTAIAWFNARKTASGKKYPALRQAEIFLKAFATRIGSIEVKHWDNRQWGEIPADFNEK